MLTVRQLEVKYGAYRVLAGVDLEVRPGELVVLLGANGAGKSTLFRTISGLHRPSAGEIRFGEHVISRLSADRIVRLGIVQCPEGRKLFPAMSVYKNLLLGAYVHRQNKALIKEKLAYIYDLFPILRERANQAAGSLSGGQQQMLAIGRALMSDPKVLLLDEPSLGLAPLIVQQMFDVIQKINRDGTMILLAEQNAHAALKIAHRAYVLENGVIIRQGTAEELLADDVVRQAYLGA
ncbi:MAG: branched-chain amino acid ABC transporter ATP-binding protein [Bacillaceae bacterium G1]|nr:branched-chain amino acid ABC transporter ATP-binding protein [Bacillota bacterium]OJF16903.1 MAG: branched-chain amino acid ABC transporter ATP-binding protein [Bacillaceae bacterium G1]